MYDTVYRRHRVQATSYTFIDIYIHKQRRHLVILLADKPGQFYRLGAHGRNKERKKEKTKQKHLLICCYSESTKNLDTFNNSLFYMYHIKTLIHIML